MRLSCHHHGDADPQQPTDQIAGGEPAAMLFSRQQASSQAQGDSAEKVTSRTKIIALLRQLKSQHELLGVQVKGQSTFSNTAILGVREDDDLFFLDELSDAGAHQAFLKQRALRVDCHLQGLELHFQCRLVNVDSSNGIAFYAIRIPTVIHRLQRRQFFRVRVDAGLSVSVSVPDLGGEALTGEAIDLSAGGLGAIFPTDAEPEIGLVIDDCSIPLPRQQPLKTRLEVRFASLDDTRHQLRLGARFIGLDLRQERLLTQFLAEMQRKRRRFGP